MTFELELTIDRWPLRSPFRTATSCDTAVETLTVSLIKGGHVGRGEASGVHYRGETAATMIAQLEGVRDRLEHGFVEEDLMALLPAGGARNALDCALWDWRARSSGRPVWQIAGLDPPQPARTTVTIGADTPDAMAARAREWHAFAALKVKLIGDGEDAARMAAIRAVRPDAWIAVDGNQGFTAASLEALLPVLESSSVALIEQPLPVGDDAALDALATTIPFAADESVQDAADLDRLPAAYSVVNIKLDKTGGLTAALALARRLQEHGRRAMVGNMIGTSLAMAPAWLVAQFAEVVDLDGPLLLARDHTPSAQYEDGHIACPRSLWGWPV